MNRIEKTTRCCYDDQYFLLGNYIDEVLVIHDGLGDLYYTHAHLYSSVVLMKTAVKVDSGITVSSITMDYNGLGYMEESTQTIRDGAARTIGYTRNQLGHPIEIDYPTAAPLTLAYTYTSLGQVDTITRGATQLVDYSYAGSMVTGRIYPQASVTFTPEYDDFGRITRHTTVNNSNVGVDFAYEYDDNGNITQQDYLHRTSQPVNEFYYDDLNRLWKADYGFGGGYEQFNYDLLGNRGSVVDTRAGGGTSNYTHNVANEYLTVCGTTVTHDNAGNLTADHRGYLYEYDMENRLTKVSRSDSTVVATFEYDALGRRIEKVDAIAGTTTRYYYDDQRVAVQTQVSGGVETDFRHFVFGNYIDEVLVMGYGTSWINFYYGHDHLYSPVVLYANNGTVVERYEYDAYGQVQVLAPNYELRTTNLYGNPYTFTGRELDTLDAGTLRLMYYRARTYDPETGRFMQRDPLGINPAGGDINPFGVHKQYFDGLNIYEYVKSNPLRYNDAFGYCHFTDLGLRAPIPIPGGSKQGEATLRIWNLSAVARRCIGHQKCKWRVVVNNAQCTGDYWWADLSAKTHEEVHVGIWRGAWSNALDTFKRFRNQCMKRSKARCYASAANLWANAHFIDGWATNLEFDAREYGVHFPDVVQEAQDKRNEANEAITKAQNKENKCDRL